MNNYEQECFDLVADMLTNRPRSKSGKVVKYTKEERETYIQLAETKKKEAEKIKKELSDSSYRLLTEIYDSVLKFLKEYVV